MYDIYLCRAISRILQHVSHKTWLEITLNLFNDGFKIFYDFINNIYQKVFFQFFSNQN